MDGPQHAYVAFAKDIASEVRLPASRRSPAGGTSDVDVRVGDVSASADGPGTRFELEGVRARVEDGSTVVVGPGAASTEGPGVVLRRCLPAVLFAHGAAVLHAGSVRVGGRGVGFLGQRDRGKSSLVAAMYDRGHRVITDDVLVLSERDGGWEALPSFPLVSLTPAASEALGLEADHVAYRADGERWYGVADGFDPDAVPFDVLYLLEERGGVASPSVRPVDGRRAMERVLAHSVRWPVPGVEDPAGRQFGQCAGLAQSLSVRALRRPDDIDAMPDVVDRIEADLGAR